MLAWVKSVTCIGTEIENSNQIWNQYRMINKAYLNTVNMTFSSDYDNANIWPDDEYLCDLCPKIMG